MSMTTLQILWPFLKLGLTTVLMSLCLLCRGTMSTGLIGTGMVVVLQSMQSMQLTTLCARQYQWLEVSSISSTTLVGCIYRPPSANSTSMNNICNLIDQALMQRKQIVVCGDLNVNMLSPEHPQTCAMSEYIITCDLHQPIEIPTRITPNSASLLDMFLVNPKEIVKTSSVLDVGISDHSMMTLTLCWCKPKSPSPCVVRRSYKKLNAEKFREDLAAVPWSVSDVFDSVDDKVDFVNEMSSKSWTNMPRYVEFELRSKEFPGYKANS